MKGKIWKSPLKSSESETEFERRVMKKKLNKFSKHQKVGVCCRFFEKHIKLHWLKICVVKKPSTRSLFSFNLWNFMVRCFLLHFPIHFANAQKYVHRFLFRFSNLSSLSLAYFKFFVINLYIFCNVHSTTISTCWLEILTV
jgi:hypothetical protein